MEAFEDERVVSEGCSLLESCLKNPDDETMKTTGREGHWEKCARAEGGEDGDEDLGMLE